MDVDAVLETSRVVDTGAVVVVWPAMTVSAHIHNKMARPRVLMMDRMILQ